MTNIHKQLLFTLIAFIINAQAADAPYSDPALTKRLRFYIKKGHSSKVSRIIDECPARCQRLLTAGWSSGKPPLHAAAKVNSLAMLNILIVKGGANVNQKNDRGQTALHLVGVEKVAQTLIANGADVNAKDNYLQTPLHQLPFNGAKDYDGFEHETCELAELFIEHNADICAQDRDGNTVLHTILQRELGLCLVETLCDAAGQRGIRFNQTNKNSVSIADIVTSPTFDDKELAEMVMPYVGGESACEDMFDKTNANEPPYKRRRLE